MTLITESIYDQWDARFAEFGYRRSDATVCPLVAAGKRCRAWHGDDACLCQRHSRVLDHARAWLDQDGRHVFTAEPYDTDSDELEALIADLHREGLRATFSGQSPWNPGGTFLIVITDMRDNVDAATLPGVSVDGHDDLIDSVPS
jgi:hypothetical protein